MRHTGQVIADGLVRCPRRGRDVDIEWCLACDAFEGIKTTGRISEVYCNRRDWNLLAPPEYVDDKTFREHTLF